MSRHLPDDSIERSRRWSDREKDLLEEQYVIANAQQRPGGLVTWLRAQLEEDERIAQSLDDYDEYGNDLTVGECMSYPCERYLAIGELRALAEVDAKRQILDWHDAALANRTAHPDDVAGAGWVLAMVKVVKLMAGPYADRPGYEEAWRP